METRRVLTRWKRVSEGQIAAFAYVVNNEGDAQETAAAGKVHGSRRFEVDRMKSRLTFDCGYTRDEYTRLVRTWLSRWKVMGMDDVLDAAMFESAVLCLCVFTKV